jgi:hypothetical protein
MPDQPRGMVVGPGDGDHVRSPIGGDMTFIVRGEQTNGALVAVDESDPL